MFLLEHSDDLLEHLWVPGVGQWVVLLSLDHLVDFLLEELLHLRKQVFLLVQVLVNLGAVQLGEDRTSCLFVVGAHSKWIIGILGCPLFLELKVLIEYMVLPHFFCFDITLKLRCLVLLRHLPLEQLHQVELALCFLLIIWLLFFVLLHERLLKQVIRILK